MFIPHCNVQKRGYRILWVWFYDFSTNNDKNDIDCKTIHFMTCETFVPYGEIVADLLRTSSLRFYMLVFLKEIVNDTLLPFSVAAILFTVGDQ